MRTDDLPAELAGLDGQRSTYLAIANGHQANEVAQRMLAGLDSDRWLIAQGTAELYREPFTPRPESWTLANALSELWHDTRGRLSPRGQRVFGSHEARRTVLVLWRSNGSTPPLWWRFPMVFSTSRPRRLRYGNWSTLKDT